jgi:hypothetical protein
MGVYRRMSAQEVLRCCERGLWDECDIDGRRVGFHPLIKEAFCQQTAKRIFLICIAGYYETVIASIRS